MVVRFLIVMRLGLVMRFWADRAVLDECSMPRGRANAGIASEIMSASGMGAGQTPRVVAVTGQSGSGTTTVAGRVIQLASHVMAQSNSGVRPTILRINMRKVRGSHALLVRLFARFVTEFSGRGFSSQYLTELFCRRLSVEATPIVIWFDNVGKNEDVKVIWTTLIQRSCQLEWPHRIVFSGTFDPSATVAERPDAISRIHVERPTPDDLLTVLRSLCAEALAVQPSQGTLLAMRERLLSSGKGLSKAPQLIREAGEKAERRGSDRIEEHDVTFLKPSREKIDTVSLNATIMESLRISGKGRRLSVGELNAEIAERLRKSGIRVPSACHVRRRLSRLEAEGLISREVVLGGNGGTRSYVSLSPSLTDGIGETTADPAGSPRGPDIPMRHPQSPRMERAPSQLATQIEPPCI